jgi:flavin reductase (DIM6/NTAB) family NADH-FMN oxidoreductase RutF
VKRFGLCQTFSEAIYFCESIKTNYSMIQSTMRRLAPNGKSPGDMHQLLVGTVAPRPIAFVSTLDANGNANLAPYSFFNVVSTQPAMLAFAPVLRGSDGTAKDTLQNLRETKEAVINVVTEPIVRQMAVTSIQYPPGVDEFTKSGLTPIPSELVKPARVKESPVHFECTLHDIISFGDKGGAGQLVICRVELMHLADRIFDEKDRIDPHQIDLMGRMGRAFYTRASGDAIHRIYQASNKLSIGYEALPETIRHSSVLTGNELGQLAGLHERPSFQKLDELRKDIGEPFPKGEALHLRIREALIQGDLELAGQLAFLETSENSETEET